MPSPASSTRACCSDVSAKASGSVTAPASVSPCGALGSALARAAGAHAAHSENAAASDNMRFHKEFFFITALSRTLSTRTPAKINAYYY